jgi:hypothetical protein
LVCVKKNKIIKGEGKRERGKEGKRERGKEGKRERGKEGKRERGKEGKRERGKEGKRERGKEGKRKRVKGGKKRDEGVRKEERCEPEDTCKTATSINICKALRVICKTI